jgi:uncharacterized membrane protein YhaH (DUF805 family)
MGSFRLFLSSSGRIERKAFVLAVLAVYGLSFASQFLLAAPLLARGGFVAFVLVQGLATWSWYALHAKRLHDSGRSSAGAIAIAVLYALAVVLFLLIMAAVTAPAPSATGDAPSANVFQLFLVLFLIGVILSDPFLGTFGHIILVVLTLALLPFVIAFSFSIWLATRPSVAPAA